MLKKFISLILLLILSSSFFVASPAFCATAEKQTVRGSLNDTAVEANIIKEGDVKSFTADDPQEDLIYTSIVATITSLIFPILTVVLIVIVLYAGLLWMLDKGEGKGVERAKKMLIAVTLGYLVTILAYYLVKLVLEAVQKSITG